MTKKEMCCPKFDPALYEKKEFSWKNKLFIKDTVRAIMHVPINMGLVIQKMQKKINVADANVPENEFVLLSLEESPWKSEQFIPVTKEIADADNVKISGKFLTKVFEGSYKDAPKWYTEMNNFVKSKGTEAKKIYSYYTTCPKCAKEYGKNYVVLFAQVS